jgi:hypothetical protein
VLRTSSRGRGPRLLSTGHGDGQATSAGTLSGTARATICGLATRHARGRDRVVVRLRGHPRREHLRRRCATGAWWGCGCTGRLGRAAR